MQKGILKIAQTFLNILHFGIEELYIYKKASECERSLEMCI